MNSDFISLVEEHARWFKSKPSVRYSTKLKLWQNTARELEPRVLRDLFLNLPCLEVVERKISYYKRLESIKINGHEIPNLRHKINAQINFEVSEEDKAWLIESNLKAEEVAVVISVVSCLYLNEWCPFLHRKYFI